MSSFRVTTKGDGSRSVFGEHDDRDRYNNDRYGNDGGRGGGRQGGGRRGGNDRSYGGGGGGRRNNNRGIYKRGKGRGLNPRSRLMRDDDDVDMGDGPSNQRYNPYGKRQQPYGRNSGGSGSKLAMDREANSAHSRLSGGGSRSRGGNRRNQRGSQRNNFDVQKSQCGWYKVTVPFASKVDRKALFQMVNDNINVPFVPSGYVINGTTGYFYVNDYDTAKALKALDKKIPFPNGHKMMLIVRPESNPPGTTDLDEAGLTLLKETMSKRYDVDAKSLNLSNFFHDPDLKAANIHMALNRPKSMTTILDIINTHIIELQGLDLSNNRLMSLDSLGEISKKAPNIVSLSLKTNNLRNIHELNKIEDLKLVELCLEGNPLCDRFNDEAPYVSAVRQRFPKVIKLDGHTLPAPVTFDVEDDTKLPPTQGSYFMTEDIQSRVCAFLAEYIKIYDSNDRQSLLGAYHDEAMLSLTASYSKLIHARQDISQYMSLSRNQMRVTDTVRRYKLLKQGRINVVSMLNELPKTEHDPNSFLVDVNLATPQLMTFSLRGVYRETESKHGDMRYFSRTFVTVPQGQGIVILNEQYHVTGATQKQVKEAFRTPAPTPSSSPVITPSTSGVAASPALTQEVKVEMVKQFASQSGMNLNFSERCLEENGWNYDGAAQVFLDLNKQGKIPPEAFVQS